MTEWTSEQLSAMHLKNRRLLISAAAGSGKTAVLAERIVRRIRDEKDPVDVNRLLVMTFTKAAAAEMRERILKRLEDAIAELGNVPEKSAIYEHLLKQAALIDSARITTIDSFCLSVIRDHADGTDLDPAFRVGGEEELNLLKRDTVAGLLKDAYEEGSSAFLRFADAYSTGKTDQGIEDLILSLYTFAESTPWPEEWYEKELDSADPEKITEESISTSAWAEYLLSQIRLYATESLRKAEAVLKVCEEPDGPSEYRKTLLLEKAKFEVLSQVKTLSGVRDGLLAFLDWPLIGRVGRNTNREKAEYVKAFRDAYKKEIEKSLTVKFASRDTEGILKDLKETGTLTGTLVRLTQNFAARYAEKKRSRNLLDFADLEHFALELLWKKEENGKRVRTAAAEEYAEEFREIYVDEYQDSNEVQEMLIRALEHGEVFMVGDVKQSIYAFRQARPSLFIDKYLHYRKYDPGTEESGAASASADREDTRIDLKKNFRSRETVLNSVNAVFSKLMQKNPGGILYDEDAALYPGAVFAAPDPADTGTRIDYGTELLLADTAQGTGEYTDRETEAFLIADRIRSLTDPVSGLRIFDREKKAYRTAQYSDIVILLRTQAGWTEPFVNTLTAAGIPAYAETNTGYFDTLEVKTVLSILSAVDNPLQDIPFAAYLRSPVIGVTEEELAVLTVRYREKQAEKALPEEKNVTAEKQLSGKEQSAENAAVRLYEKVTALQDADELTEALKQKLRHALALRKSYEEDAPLFSLPELIRRIYDETGYYAYASALPAGNVRRANLDMLLNKASAFENTGYRGLFNFIRYIENLKKYDTDFGEASPSGECEDAVRIMSIHHSKGLEFPICIVAGLGKKFNLQDVSARIVADEKLGIGADYVDPELHVKGSTIKKNAIAWRIRSETLGEELRVLYVAMTRAKDKLILTAAGDGLENAEKKAAERSGAGSGGPVMTDLLSAGNCLDWILMAIHSAPGEAKIRTVVRDPSAFLLPRDTQHTDPDLLKKTVLADCDAEAAAGDQAGCVFPYPDAPYPFAEDVDLHTKLSVSELKVMGQEEDEAETERAAFLNQPEGERSFGAEGGKAFGAEGGKAAGAERGTVYHKIMEKLPYRTVTDAASFGRFLAGLKAEGLFTEEEAAGIREEDFRSWIGSPLMKRMAEADLKGKLKREAQFVMALPAREVYPDKSSEEPVLIQGIMDAWFEEDGELVLVDYKTDRVTEAGMLVQKYKIQLDYYAKALTMMKGKPVREKMIWSFALGRAISL